MRHAFKKALLLLVPGLCAGLSQAQSYPIKPIHIHTANPGSSPDIAARVMAPVMWTALGQPIVVENRNVATVVLGVAKAPPDGYTLIFYGGALWLTPLLQETAYDPIRDFAPITTLTKAPNLFVVHPSLPAKTVKELIALLKTQPGKFNYASAGRGTVSELGGNLFKSIADVDFVLVKYSGGANQSTTDLMAGVTQMTIGPGAVMAAQIKAGKLRALATTGSQPSTLFPDLPTVSASLPGFTWDSIFGAFAPAKTPDAIIRRLNQELVKTLEDPEVRDKLFKSGYETAGGSPEELGNAVKSEMARVSKLMKDGIKE